jgi:hypothetical protein
MGKVHGSLARAGKVKSQTRMYPLSLSPVQRRLTCYSQGKPTRSPPHVSPATMNRTSRPPDDRNLHNGTNTRVGTER